MVAFPTDIEVASVISEMESQRGPANEFSEFTDRLDIRNEAYDFSELDQVFIKHLSKMEDYKSIIDSDSFSDILDLYRFAFLVGLKAGRSQAALDNLSPTV